jgi:hypothetical protein
MKLQVFGEEEISALPSHKFNIFWDNDSERNNKHLQCPKRKPLYGDKV